MYPDVLLVCGYLRVSKKSQSHAPMQGFFFDRVSQSGDVVERLSRSFPKEEVLLKSRGSSELEEVKWPIVVGKTYEGEPWETIRSRISLWYEKAARTLQLCTRKSNELLLRDAVHSAEAQSTAHQERIPSSAPFPPHPDSIRHKSEIIYTRYVLYRFRP